MGTTQVQLISALVTTTAFAITPSRIKLIHISLLSTTLLSNDFLAKFLKLI